MKDGCEKNLSETVHSEKNTGHVKKVLTNTQNTNFLRRDQRTHSMNIIWESTLRYIEYGGYYGRDIQ